MFLLENIPMVRMPLLAGLLFVGFFQTPTAPPMKMGLWEQTTVVNMKMTGANVPPGMPTNQTMKSRACYTPETWTKILASSPNKSCTFSNQSIAGGHLSMDISCASLAMKMHIDGVFSTPEAGHGTVHMEMNNAQMNMVSESTYETHFLSSDCGAVAPGKTEIVR
jgi:hypothetical protein